jgi:hypothetical protein
MQLRLLLLATVLLGVGAIGMSEFIVRPHLKSLVSSRDRNLRQYQEEQRVHNETKGVLNQAQAKQQEAERNLLTAGDQLALANGRASEREQFAKRLQTELNKSKQELAAAKGDLAAWASLPIVVDQVKAVVSEVKRLRTQNEALKDELELGRMIASTQIACRLTEEDPILPSGLNGKVLVVDPKYDFVVLDIGAEKGVERRGKLLVARQGQLIGKVSVTSVEEHRCIANVVPGWKLRELREGDLVLY